MTATKVSTVNRFITRRRLAIGTGIVAITVVMIATVAVVLRASDTQLQTVSQCAFLEDSIGLYKGNPVTHMGVRVGRVDDITPEGGDVRVQFTVGRGREYPADVKAVTRSKSLLADRGIELVGDYRGGPRLEPGQCIPLSRTYTPKSIAEIAGSAADFIQSVAPQKGADSQMLSTALAGLANALQGQGERGRDLVEHAGGASIAPDQFVGDVDSIVRNMAPLTTSALQDWPQLQGILDRLPEVVIKARDLLPDVYRVCVGVAWTVATLASIQENYGKDLWPFMNGPVSDLIKAAAQSSGRLNQAIGIVPSMAGLMRQQSAGLLEARFEPPTVRLPEQALRTLCAAHPGASFCSRNASVGNILDLVVALRGAR